MKKTPEDFKAQYRDYDDYECYEQDLSEFGVTGVSFNVDWIPPDQRDWFLQVLSKQMYMVAKTAHDRGVNSTRRKIRDALFGEL